MMSLHRSALMPCTTSSRAILGACTRHAGYAIHRNGNGNVQIIRHAYSKSKGDKISSNTTPSTNTSNIDNNIKKPIPKPLPYQSTHSPSNPKNDEQGSQGGGEGETEGPREYTMRDLVRERWLALLGAGAGIACLGYFASSLAMYMRQEPSPCHPLGCEPNTPTGRPSLQSPYEFDMHLDKSEHRFGITKLRRELGTRARGHVLEVAIGTGRNFEFYDWDVVTNDLLTEEERLEKERKKKKGGWWWLPFGFGRVGSTGGEKETDVEENENAVLSFTGVDVSPGMLDIALRRVRQLVPHMHEFIPKSPSFAMVVAQQQQQRQRSPEQAQVQGHVASFLSDRIRLMQSDVQTGLPAPPSTPSPTSPQKYDTILQTFGLCSVRDPVSLLASMSSVLVPGTGRILLLEHGRSVWDAVNALLDRGARGHHERFGCWWNRDIEAVVHEAARRVPGLEIVRFERPGWITGGTHIVVEMRLVDGTATNADDRGGGDAGRGGGKKEPTTSWGSVLSSVLSIKGGDGSKKD
ncbi:hypothetical protein F5Y17DRAFT_452656 [Xylariaceae sp. FL0594]|nr:hypothetical protein F5Y17DRAFT_452656 [Xylariaceae sp. FL0594]